MKFLGALVLLLFLPAPAFCSKIKHITANGANFLYVEKGRGTPILLVHGSLSDFTMWSAQMDVLGQNHRVVALSRRYHWPNASKEDPKDYTPQLHANDVAAIIQALKLGPVHLVGHSYGGFICAYVAKEHPELARSVTLIEPPIFSFLPPQPVPPPFITAALSFFAKGQDDSAVKTFIDGVEGPGSFDQLSPKIQRHMLLNARELRSELRMAPDQYLPRFTCDDARQIKGPIFLVKGAKSPDFLRTIVDQMHTCVPSSSEAEISAASHGVQFENPQAFNDALLQFLRHIEKEP